VAPIEPDIEFVAAVTYLYAVAGNTRRR